MWGVRVVAWLFFLLGWGAVASAIGLGYLAYSGAALSFVAGNPLHFVLTVLTGANAYYAYAALVGSALLLFFFWSLLAGLGVLYGQGEQVRAIAQARVDYPELVALLETMVELDPTAESSDERRGGGMASEVYDSLLDELEDRLDVVEARRILVSPENKRRVTWQQVQATAKV